MMLQNIMNVKNGISEGAKAKRSPGKAGPKVLLDKLKDPEKAFRKLLQNEGETKKTQAGKIDFSKLLDLLNLSPDKLKEKIAKMGKTELKDIEDMIQLGLASILQKLHNSTEGKLLPDIGISKKLLQKVRKKLGLIQQFVDQRKESLGMTEKETKYFELNNNRDKSSTKAVNSNPGSSKNQGLAAQTKADKLNSQSNVDPKSTNVDPKSAKNNAVNLDQVSVSSKNKDSSVFKVDLSAVEKMNQAEKIYHTTLKKQAAARENVAKDLSADLKNLAKKGAGLSPDLNTKFDLKKLKKTNNLIKLLNESGLDTSNKELNGLNKGQNSTFSQFFSGEQDQKNFNQFFGLNGSNQSPGENSSLTGGGNNISQNQTAVFRGEELASQITEQIKLLKKPAGNQLKLQLEPEFLGKVKMNLKVDAGEVTARFMVDNLLVKNHLDHNISQLRSALTNQGFNIDNMEVEAENTGYDMGEEDSSDQDYGQEKNNNRNGQHYNYRDYDSGRDDLADLSPEEIEMIMETDPAELKRWGYGRKENWFTHGGYYQRMNLLA